MILEPVGPHVEQGPPHALTFQLEYAHRFGPPPATHRSRRHRAGSRRDRGDAARFQEIDRFAQDRQRLQSEEIEFHQARLLHHFMLNW